MTDPTTPQGRDELRALANAAHVEIERLCAGSRWRMTVPLREDDSDVLLSKAVTALPALLDLIDAQAAREADAEARGARRVVEAVNVCLRYRDATGVRKVSAEMRDVIETAMVGVLTDADRDPRAVALAEVRDVCDRAERFAAENPDASPDYLAALLDTCHDLRAALADLPDAPERAGVRRG